MSAEHIELGRLIMGRTTTKAVERILTAGYRKPQQVTTVEELDALPDGSIILEAHGSCREGLRSIGGRNFWRTMGPAKVLTSNEISLPATVLHVGGAE